MAESIKFGDIFLYKEREHVFLTKTAETVYAAQILDQEGAKKIQILDDLRSKRPDGYKFASLSLYCYVILSTEGFKGRMAHLHNADKNESDIKFEKSGFTLNKEDMQSIKKEICDPSSPVALELKDLISQLDIQ